MMTTIQTARGPITIRATSADDATRLRALRLEALTSSPTSFGSGAEDIDSHDWVELATGGANDAVFVAEHAGELIGLTGIHRSSRRPAWRKLGLAQTLVNASVDWARAQGVAIVKLTVVPESGAMPCYLRCGFRVTGVDPAAIRWEGKYYDEVLMSRWVKPAAN